MCFVAKTLNEREDLPDKAKLEQGKQPPSIRCRTRDHLTYVSVLFCHPPLNSVQE